MVLEAPVPLGVVLDDGFVANVVVVLDEVDVKNVLLGTVLDNTFGVDF